MENKNLKYDAASYSLTSSSLSNLQTTMPSNELNHQHNDNIITNLHIDDLLFLEKDLDFYEKVSLIFLCYGTERLRAAYALQRLQTLQYRSDSSTFLSDWAIEMQSSNSIPSNDWKSFLIEALCIIKANHVLLKLGFHLPELYVHFLPHATPSLYVHPVLKELYNICEQLTQSEAMEMIQKTESNHQNDGQINFNEFCLEIFLLKWLSNGIISVGEWQNNLPIRNRQIHCDIDCILMHLKCMEKDALRLRLQSAQINLNFTSKNRITCEKKNGEKYAVDDEDNGKIERKLSATSIDYSQQQGNSSQEIKSLSDNKNYRIRRESAGQVLIINQSDFHQSTKNDDELILEKRKGTDCDKRKLTETFQSRGFTVHEKDNVTSSDIILSIRQLIKQNQAFDSIIICILSHGNDGLIYGSDSLPIKIDDLKNELCCTELINKPKILIIQACQGESIQKAYPIALMENDTKLAFDGPTKISPIKTAAIFGDYLLFRSTTTGFKSIRHEDNGSWFIQTLCNTIDNSNDKHFMDIVTSTIQQVSEKRARFNQCQVPEVTSLFRKAFYLPEKRQ